MPSRPGPSRRGRAALLAAVPALLLGLVVSGPAAAEAGSPTTGGTPSLEQVVAANPQAEQVDARTVVFDGGSVVLVYPAASGDALASTTSSSSSCPSGWFCLFDYPGYGGRMLQFRDCGVTQSLYPYGFAGAASSWANKRSRSSYAYAGGYTIWAAYAGASDYSVDAADNDRADAVRLGC